MTRPAAIRTEPSNAFAHDTVKRRLPAIARETAARNPDYPAGIATALEQLARDLENDAPIPTIADPDWAALLQEHGGETWLGTEWFFGETYFYRLLLDTVGWEDTRRDPFAPHKIAELQSASLRSALFAAFEMTPAEPEDRLTDRLLRALWGNRIDLSLPSVMAHGSSGGQDDLLADDRDAIIAHLRASVGGEVHLVADNTGTELAMDWLLIDALLDDAQDDLPFIDRVTLHVKIRPTFVSDATRDDALTLLAELGGRGSLTGGFGHQAAGIAERLQAALLDGRLTVAEHTLWNSGYFLWDQPEQIAALFADARLVIFKGDANYRRLIGDAVWDSTTPFGTAMGYFPAPVMAMRTLKSDPILGLAAGQADALDQINPRWHVNGKYGVIQFSGGRG